MKEHLKSFPRKDAKKLSNDALDVVAAITLISVGVLGLIFWLSDMPY